MIGTERGLPGAPAVPAFLTLIKAGLDVLQQAFRLVASSELTRMTGISEYLSNDHRRCDGLFADTEAAVGKRDWERATPVGGEI